MVIVWFLLFSGLLWLIINHPIKKKEKRKDNYGYFFDYKNNSKDD
ncbi:hypothetical protein [Selenihalanaerobacter shriftii]|uniref:Uncharacterized protein n=1 Tax=Selenihalanaerobacter shriftii TaxID=142842 RepID=A0A1T4P9P1_9FIRM|nr:hypothetical protein [Selenihalanaerobacter shriftii]SJZ88169.1 hypothetical protein SAMN02745118_02086 [Selenihalanaerobacter shriftii]